MTRSLPSLETGNQVGDIDTASSSLFKEIGNSRRGGQWSVDSGEAARRVGEEVVPLLIGLRKVGERRYHWSASEPMSSGWKKDLTRLRNPKENANPDAALYSLSHLCTSSHVIF